MIEAIYEARPVVLANLMSAPEHMKKYWQDRMDQLNAWDRDYDFGINKNRQQAIAEECREMAR